MLFVVTCESWEVTGRPWSHYQMQLHGSLVGALVFHSFGPRGGLTPSAPKDSVSCFRQLSSPTSAPTWAPQSARVSAPARGAPLGALPEACEHPVGEGAEPNIHPAPCPCRHGLPGLHTHYSTSFSQRLPEEKAGRLKSSPRVTRLLVGSGARI